MIDSRFGDHGEIIIDDAPDMFEGGLLNMTPPWTLLVTWNSTDPTWISNQTHKICTMELLIYPEASPAAPLNFGNKKVIASHTS